MPEDLKVDCHECKDLEFARNLARSMAEGYGRHNSRRDFRNLPNELWDVVETARNLARQRIARHNENQQPRVIGRFQDRFIQSQWEWCQIGDAVRAEHFGHDIPSNILFVERMKSKPDIYDGTKWCQPIEPIDSWTFERVRFEMRSTEDGRWHDQTLWKRIS